MEKMRVLVTGNEGYIGSVVTAHLQAHGYAVIGYDSGLFREVAFIPRTGSPAHQLYKDIRDVTVEDLRDIDAVIHLAGLSNDPVGQLDATLTDEINHRATIHMAMVAKAAGVQRFLFSSSCSMYGASNDKAVDETAQFNPQTAYAQSKIDAERDLQKLADHRFSPTYLRNATVFGLSPRLRLDLVVQNLLALGFISGVVQLTSDGTPWRPLVHVDDVAEAFHFLLQQPRERVHNQAFNIGRDDLSLQIKEIAQAVAAVLPHSQIKLSNQASSDTRSYRVSMRKIESLGWQARHDLHQGIRDLYLTFQAVNFSTKHLQSDHYITLQHYLRAQQQGILDKNLRLRATIRPPTSSG
jgi:nucleoside-diphosphate-sugar epimerase